jgi:hypothetical protein
VFIPDVGSHSSIIGFVQVGILHGCGVIFLSHKPRYHHEEKRFCLATRCFFAKTGLPDHERVWVIAMINRCVVPKCGIFILDDSSPNLLICYDPERCSLSARVLCSTRWQIFSSCVQANSREGAGGAHPMAACNVKGFDFIHVKT